MNTAIAKILNYEITPRQVPKKVGEMMANYGLTYDQHPLAFRQAIQIHNRIKLEADNWSDSREALYRLWRGAVIAARQLATGGRCVSLARDSYERRHNFFAYVWSEQGERYTIERWTVYPTSLREYIMWRCNCKDCEYRAPARDAAPTLDAPTVKYCKHIFAAAIFAAVVGPPAEPVTAVDTPDEPTPPFLNKVALKKVTSTRRLRVLKAPERLELQRQAFGRGYDQDEEQAKRRLVVNAVARHRDRLNARHGRTLKRKMTAEELASWEQQYQQSQQEAEELFT